MSGRGLSLTALHLCCSLLLQRRYSSFRSTLQKFLPLGNSLPPPTVGTEGIDAALEVLQTRRMRKKAEEEEEEAEARTATGDDLGAVAMNQDENPVEKPSQPQDLADNAFEALVSNAIEEFGFAPRDVYNGIFTFPKTKARHVDEVKNIEYSKLKALVEVFSRDRGLDNFSHHVVAVKPHYRSLDDDSWEIDFKSTRIARQVVEVMWSKEDGHLRDMYALLHKVPDSSCFAGSIFEAIAHRVLPRKYIQPIPMVSDNRNPPTFSTRSTPLLPPTPPRDHIKTIVRVDLVHGLSSVTCNRDRFYIPTSTTNPLFDSFTIDIDADKRTAVISVFHITVSPRHGGSSKGYLLIRKIMVHVRKLLGLPSRGPEIEVLYFLVCPGDGSQYQWDMPVDWNQNTIVNDHRGKAYCIRIPSGHDM